MCTCPASAWQPIRPIRGKPLFSSRLQVLPPHAIAHSSVFVAASMDMADMPPPYIPVIFSLAIVVGVGVLQMSLGDVMAEEADLGISSGINARKEAERKSKSYFERGPRGEQE